MAPTPKQFADQIRAAVQASGRAAADIARDTGISESFLSRFIRGEAWIGEEKLNTLARYLGISVGASAQKTQTRRKK
jgi:transcriptional regulator with XRE-family HTH domain